MRWTSGTGFILLQRCNRPASAGAPRALTRAALCSNRDSVKRAAHRLRDLGLLRCERIPPHRPHPFRPGRYTRNNVLRFDVDVEWLGALLHE
ncbi:MAG TPA: hypothetical protein VE987_08320 [Polyangiaceae bacterium]|nr:hypothetical protein [Polyangiaceae bacterium]